MKRIDIELIKEIKFNNVKAIDKLKEKRRIKEDDIQKLLFIFLRLYENHKGKWDFTTLDTLTSEEILNYGFSMDCANIIKQNKLDISVFGGVSGNVFMQIDAYDRDDRISFSHTHTTVIQFVFPTRLI